MFRNITRTSSVSRESLFLGAKNMAASKDVKLYRTILFLLTKGILILIRIFVKLQITGRSQNIEV